MTTLARTAITGTSTVAEYPVSSGQRRMWLLDQLDNKRTAFNVVIPLRLSGPLNVPALAAGLSAIVARHEVLRTAYAGRQGEPVAVVHPVEPVEIVVTDVSDLTRAERLAHVQRTHEEQETRRFDLAQAPVLRAELLRLAEGEHVLFVVVHHIAMDAASRPILLSELGQEYSARAGARPVPAGESTVLPELAEQYGDHARRQAARLAGPDLAAALEHWRERLTGLPVLDLPTDRTPPDVPSGSGGFARRPLPQSLLEALTGLAAAEGVQLTSILFAAVQTLLHRYTGQEDFGIGTTLTGRDQPALQGLIGYFTDTVVLRADLAGEPSFRELLHRVDGALLAAREQAWVPFESIVRELAPERGSAGRSPLFRVYTAAYDSSQELSRFDGLEVRALPSDFSTARFDLGLVLDTDAQGTGLSCSFDLDLFDPSTAERILGHLHTLLASALADPDRRLGVLGLLTAVERDDVLDAWNDTACPFPADATLHRLFEKSAAARGDLTAIQCGDQRLSYAELDAEANRLAGWLRAQGVGRDVVVGVRMPRSVRQAVAVLGVLKAGGAFLPIDPDYPPARAAMMLTDSGAFAVLSTPGLGDPLEDGVRVIDLEALDLTDQPPTAPEVDVDPLDLAFVMYTSGSTGRPKGIALAHRGAVNNYTDFNRRLGIGPGDSLLGVSSPSFDMSVYDLLGTFAAGARLVLPAQSEVKEPARWAELMRLERITVWHSAPALLELLVETLNSDGRTLPDLRLSLLSGDWIPVDLPDRIRALAPVQVIALGGATEASMDSVIYPVGEVDPAWTSIPYGAPMANQRTYVLDQYGNPQPIGIPGELCLAGVGLAREYLNRPELTAERFVWHVFDGRPPERLYRTGDLARYRPDGVLELLGRMDFQVKVHGLRIELGEIETALTRHPAVAEAAVVAQGERGNHTLAGFVTLTPTGSQQAPADLSIDLSTGPLIEQLRAHLLTSLPAHMVPPSLTVLTALPTTPNGKVDRLALIERRATHVAGKQGPRDALEARIELAWRTVLGAGELGIDDDFFRAGGDSFAAVRAMLAVDVNVPVIEMFKHPTVRGLAAAIRAGGVGDGGRLLHEMTPLGRPARITVLALPYGGGNAVAYQALAQALPDHIALWALSQPGYDPSGSPADFRSFDDIVEQTAAEVEERISGPVLVYGHCAGTAMAAALGPALEGRGVDLRGVYLAASLPESEPEAAIARAQETDNASWADYLRSLGGLDGALEWATIDHIMLAGRNDHLGAMEFHRQSRREAPAPIQAPITCVFGDADPATEGWEQRYRDWERFGTVRGVEIIPGGRHYFVRDRAEDLASFFEEQFETLP